MDDKLDTSETKRNYNDEDEPFGGGIFKSEIATFEHGLMGVIILVTFLTSQLSIFAKISIILIAFLTIRSPFWKKLPMACNRVFWILTILAIFVGFILIVTN